MVSFAFHSDSLNAPADTSVLYLPVGIAFGVSIRIVYDCFLIL